MQGMCECGATYLLDKHLIGLGLVICDRNCVFKLAASEDIEGIMFPELANALAFDNSECTDDRC